MKILITSGGTKVDIDPVRHIANMSSGTMGRKIALSALSKGHHVRFLTSRDGKTPFSIKANLEQTGLPLFEKMLDELKQNHTRYRHKYEESIYDTYEDYQERLIFLLENWSYDAIILCAAVSDYTVEYSEEKMKSSDNMSIQLIPTKKLIPEVTARKGNAKVIAFKLLNDVARTEMSRVCDSYINKYDIDMIVGNDLLCLKNGGYYHLHVTKNDKQLVYNDISDKLIEKVESLCKE